MTPDPTRPQTVITPRLVAIGQGLFFLFGGVWPLVSMRSFEAVTGPKVDRWLVRTVALLLSVIGGGLLLAARRQRVTGEVALIGAGSAGALALIDVIYTSNGRIAKVYLLDGLAQALIIGAWLLAWRRERALAAVDRRPGPVKLAVRAAALARRAR